MQYILSMYATFLKPLVLISMTFLLLRACTEKKVRTEQSSRSNVIPVVIAPIDTVSSVNQISASGLLSTEHETRLSFKLGGVIDKVLIEEGQVVRKGQLLASLNRTEISAQVQQVQLTLEKAQRDYQRLSNLYKDSVVTLEQFQNSKTALDMAHQHLQQVQFNRQYANIFAPSNGFIVKKLLNTGEVTAPGIPVLVMSELGNGSKWVLRVGVSDRDWALIEKGNTATVTIDAFPENTFVAKVTKKALAADMASGSFQIELTLDVKGLQPAVGMFGKTNITLNNTIKGYSIPYEALLEANGNKGFVFVTDDQKTVQKVEVLITSIESHRVVIDQGLGGHAFVVISGSPYLTNGSDIKVTQKSPSSTER